MDPVESFKNANGLTHYKFHLNSIPKFKFWQKIVKLDKQEAAVLKSYLERIDPARQTLIPKEWFTEELETRPESVALDPALVEKLKRLPPITGVSTFDELKVRR